MFDSYDEQPSSPTRNHIDVELVYHKTVDNDYLVAESEGDKPFKLNRNTTRVVDRNPPYATIRMSERRAIEAGLA